jgi:putative ribosome biogenesis GTPase RsgA
MAVEAFINFYGVHRLGEQQFNRHVERLPIERKVQLLLLICDGVEVDKEERLVIALNAVAQRRNQLAHPKAKEVPRDQPAEDRTGNPIPETAQQQVQAMREFFTEFGRLVPRSRHLLPVELQAVEE